MEKNITPVEIIIEHVSLNKGQNYSVRINENNTVEYNGISNVKTLGKQITKVTSEELQSIIFQFENYYFFSFEDRYEPSNQSKSQNQQQTVISIRLGQKFKKITYAEDGNFAPPAVKYLVKTIENITKVDQLSGTNK
jgi:hypothetical protein